MVKSCITVSPLNWGISRKRGPGALNFFKTRHYEVLETAKKTVSSQLPCVYIYKTIDGNKTILDTISMEN